MRQQSEQTNIANSEFEFCRPGVVDNHIDNVHLLPGIDSNGDASDSDQSKIAGCRPSVVGPNTGTPKDIGH
jgi:hypothetical protein